MAQWSDLSNGKDAHYFNSTVTDYVEPMQKLGLLYDYFCWRFQDGEEKETVEHLLSLYPARDCRRLPILGRRYFESISCISVLEPSSINSFLSSCGWFTYPLPPMEVYHFNWLHVSTILYANFLAIVCVSLSTLIFHRVVYLLPFSTLSFPLLLSLSYLCLLFFTTASNTKGLTYYTQLYQAHIAACLT